MASSTDTSARPAAAHAASGRALVLAALGIVFGDIGTSPLYAFRECFMGAHAAPRTADNVLGVLSLMFWALALIISVKYLSYVMRADDKGEGGILALMALAAPSPGAWSSLRGRVVLALGLFGAGLLFGDGIITPAISVLSAAEGVKDAASSLEPAVLPLTIGVLVALFMIQSRGTAKVGAVFGPVMVVWFTTLALLGLVHVVRHPTVLHALWPGHAIGFLWTGGTRSFLVLGSVFLVVTGGEALYADMGHFGLAPIRKAWFLLVWPALTANYFGQGALVLEDARAFESPFYGLAPSWALLPLILLSTAATVIASQAVISGVFSLARQASMLGFWPRLRVRHTSDEVMGQIYVPSVNYVMMVATIALVLGFRSSSALASAYGIAVTTTMVITTILAALVARHRWHWRLALAAVVTAAFLLVDGAFFAANLFKIGSGGEFPLIVAASVYLLMTTWSYGRGLLGQYVRKNLVPLGDFGELMRVEVATRVPGSAVFMSSNPEGTPPALLHNFLHNHVVHERVVLLTITVLDTARVSEHERLSVEPLGDGFYRLTGRYGFVETPDIQTLLTNAQIEGLALEHTTFFLGRDIPLTERGRKATWRHKIFAVMARNSVNATTFFNLPAYRVMEIGYQLEL